ncbi:AAA family ATPase [Streptomyces sp. NPDC046984]|uniref:AAA family ATPase n=1 Tax=Streptomyces sp. NPDC046984 TaxID=3155138 RepID=UPI0033F0E980
MNPEAVVAALHRRIVGQDEAIAEIARVLKLAQASIQEIDKPLAVLMFLGPSGVGKTEMVRQLARAIHGSLENGYCRIDMSGLGESHYAASLAGSPPGYIGSNEGETLLAKAQIEGAFHRPGILLLDEIEKAHPRVHQSLLQVFDNARLKLASGREEIDFRNTIIAMTSNAGSAALGEIASLRSADMDSMSSCTDDGECPQSRWDSYGEKTAEAALSSIFSPEFINRIDATIVFRWLDKGDILKIVDQQISDLNVRLAENYGVRLAVGSESRWFLVENGFDLKYGARSVKRAIRRYLMEPLADLLLERELAEGSVISTKVEGDFLQVMRHPLPSPIAGRRYHRSDLQIARPSWDHSLYPYPKILGGRGAAVKVSLPLSSVGSEQEGKGKEN